MSADGLVGINGAARIVKDQGGRGPGLVAARAIEGGEIIGTYSGKFVPMEDADSMTKEDVEYRYDIGIEGFYFRDSDWKTDGSIGHLINDGTPPAFIDRLRGCSTIGICEEWALKYTSNFALAATSKIGASSDFGPESSDTKLPNVQFVESKGERKGLYVRAVADIKEGDDILTAYGADYWLGLAVLNESFPPETRMGLVGYAMRKMVFPVLGIVKKVPAIIFPILSVDGEKEMAVMRLHGSDESEIVAMVQTTVGLQALAAKWLKLVGFPSGDLLKWCKQCERVGTTQVPNTAEDYTEVEIGRPEDVKVA